MTMPSTNQDDDSTRQQVREGYAKIAQSGGWSAAQALTILPTAANTPSSVCCGGGSDAGGGCCGPATFTPQQLATAIGYSQSELASTPDESNMGLSCGNPTAIASLKKGEIVLDLGAGGGFDCFVAAR